MENTTLNLLAKEHGLFDLDVFTQEAKPQADISKALETLVISLTTISVSLSKRRRPPFHNIELILLIAIKLSTGASAAHFALVDLYLSTGNTAKALPHISNALKCLNQLENKFASLAIPIPSHIYSAIENQKIRERLESIARVNGVEL